VTQKYADDTFKGLLGLNAVVFILAFTVAELQWTNGYCVEVRVPEIVTGTKKVQPNSDTPFTATVRHKFEGTELTVPVIATLADGQVSVDPSGSKVPAPASFTYKAPDKSGQTATVTLETRSRRGIGILTVTFETGNLGYNVDAPWGETHIFGKICSGLGNYFTLKWDTPVGLSGTIDFMPSNENGGTWSLTGSLAGGGVTNSGEGSYTIESTTEGIPAMIVLQGQITQTTVGYGDYTSSISGSSIPLEPDACSQP
jgi:hypothetical protein